MATTARGDSTRRHGRTEGDWEMTEAERRVVGEAVEHWVPDRERVDYEAVFEVVDERANGLS